MAYTQWVMPAHQDTCRVFAFVMPQTLPEQLHVERMLPVVPALSNHRTYWDPQTNILCTCAREADGLVFKRTWTYVHLPHLVCDTYGELRRLLLMIDP